MQCLTESNFMQALPYSESFDPEVFLGTFHSVSLLPDKHIAFWSIPGYVLSRWRRKIHKPRGPPP